MKTFSNMSVPMLEITMESYNLLLDQDRNEFDVLQKNDMDKDFFNDKMSYYKERTEMLHNLIFEISLLLRNRK